MPAHPPHASTHPTSPTPVKICARQSSLPKVLAHHETQCQRAPQLRVHPRSNLHCHLSICTALHCTALHCPRARQGDLTAAGIPRASKLRSNNRRPPSHTLQIRTFAPALCEIDRPAVCSLASYRETGSTIICPIFCTAQACQKGAHLECASLLTIRHGAVST